MIERKSVVKIFMLWQEDKYEKWLQDMSKQGWHLERITPYPGIVFHFVKGQPKDYIYKLDYKATRDKDIKEYAELFEKAGWEYVTHDFAWKYFRREAALGECPEIYTDVDSKVQMYKNVTKLLWVLLFAIIVAFLNIAITTLTVTGMPFERVYQVLAILIFLVMLLTIYGIWKTKKKIKKFILPLHSGGRSKGITGTNFISKYVRVIFIIEFAAIVGTLIQTGIMYDVLPTYHPGWKQAAVVNFADGDLKDQALYTFRTEGEKEVQLLLEIKNFNARKLLDLSVKGSNGTDILIVHGEQYWSNYNKITRGLKLDQGTYEVVLNLADAKGKMRLYVK